MPGLKDSNDYPSLSYLTSPDYGKPPTSNNSACESLGKPHIDSFNYMLGEGIRCAVANISPVEFIVPETKQFISLWICDCKIACPTITPGCVNVKNSRIYPTEARQRGISYKGNVSVCCSFSIDGVTQPFIHKSLGEIPIMVHSNACNLNGFSPSQLIKHGEQESDWGGYFIIGGHERLVRMLQKTRSNYPIAMQRSSWRNRGQNFSDLGIMINCVRLDDLTSSSNVLHYVTTGSAKLMFNFGNEFFFVPVFLILKCLLDRSDAFIFTALTAGICFGSKTNELNVNSYYEKSIVNMMREIQEEGIFSMEQAKVYLGQTFREKLNTVLPNWYSDQDICEFIIRSCIAIHLDADEDKFNLIAFMIKKLFALVEDACVFEGADSVMMHEVVLGGHLYLQLLKERLESWLVMLKMSLMQKVSKLVKKCELNTETVAFCISRMPTIERSMNSFIGTGNLSMKSMNLGFTQNKGITIVAENINRMRYMSHFRAVHRGAFFQEMRTTEVRALLPEAWGFICPVHTPDGAPCGLLNHLAMPVRIVTHPLDASRIPKILEDFGLISLDDAIPIQCSKSEFLYHVVLNGRVLGYVRMLQAEQLTQKLRELKVMGDSGVPYMSEIVFLQYRSNNPGQFPGIYIFTGPSRMMRPVINLALQKIEMIGTFEQVYMNICIRRSESYPGLTTHMEIRPTSFLSNLACTIPLPDFNQSPRNMYQCQMGKQTMATPTHTWHLNSETKMYRLQTPGSPFFRPAHYDLIGLDDYPMGTNAVVAVISYTGYDMEDAMVINRSSLDRGFCAGSIYKAEFVDLREISGGSKFRDTNECGRYFERDPGLENVLIDHIDADGLPYVGAKLLQDYPLYCYFDVSDNKYVVKKYEAKELAYVDSVKVCSNDAGLSEFNRICISYRLPRNPSVGDKFASRAGQKGICSQKWASEDLPWTESGMNPDIIFNPHGFPSRMTIAMMIECMAGKSGAINGQVHDATPFTFSDTPNNDAIDYFGLLLEQSGYNYYGTETMFSGTDGVEMQADIFFGIIHYQRLRHMVSDKYQVRNVGLIDQVTHQPIKGRRKGGGVRFGEMERDGLLSHGSMFLLQDRLFHGSDKTRVKLCRKCGSVLSPRIVVPPVDKQSIKLENGEKVLAKTQSKLALEIVRCVICKEWRDVCDIDIPFILLHLIAQMAAVNISMKISTKHI